MADMAYQVFVDLDATALEGGAIYLGVPNDDPELNPIPVYWDEALTVLATQPLRTSGGVIVRDGTPSDVYAAQTAYSIRVRNRAGKVVWYKTTTGGTAASRLTFPIPAGPPGADSTVPGPANSTYTTLAALKAAAVSNASYIFAPPSGSDGGAAAGTFLYQTAGAPYTADGVNVIKLDAVPLSIGALVRQAAQGINLDGRNVQDKLFETVSITDARFAGGAKTSRSDNTAQIQAAIDYVAGRGGGTVTFPAGQYKHSAAILVRAYVRLQGEGDGAQLLSTNTDRLDGIRAFGPSSDNRMPGVSIDNLRLTSTFTKGASFATGNAISAKWLIGAKITRVKTDYWSDSGIALTDCTRCLTSDVEIDNVSQGFDCFNDSENCALTNAVFSNIFTYVPLNAEGLANGSTFRPRDFIASNISVKGFITHGINLVNAVRPVVVGWSCQGGIGSVEGPGNGIEVYGCLNPVIGPGIAYNNAGHGVVVGPTQNDATLVGVRTINNAAGGLLVTDGGGIGTSLRTAVSGCAFMEGAPQLVGNASILNTVQQQTIEAGLPMQRMAATATGKRNAQQVFSSSLDADQIRVGVDLSTNNGTKIWQVYFDGYADQVLSADPGSIAGGIDNTQSLGRSDRRFSTVYAGTGTINTSDQRHKQQTGPIPDEWLDAWGDVDWCHFKFNDAVAAKGDDARWHIGLIAQQVLEAFQARGLDATAIGLICHDEWDAEPAREEERDPEGNVTVPAYPGRPAGDLWSVRMTECLAMDAAYQRREIQRLKDALADANRSQDG